MIVSLILPQIGVHCLPNMAMETNGDRRPKPFDVFCWKIAMSDCHIQIALELLDAYHSLANNQICWPKQNVCVCHMTCGTVNPLEKSVLKPKFLRIKRATQSLEGAIICQDPVDIVPSLIFNPHLFCLFCMSLSPLSKKWRFPTPNHPVMEDQAVVVKPWRLGDCDLGNTHMKGLQIDPKLP